MTCRQALINLEHFQFRKSHESFGVFYPKNAWVKNMFGYIKAVLDLLKSKVNEEFLLKLIFENRNAPILLLKNVTKLVTPLLFTTLLHMTRLEMHQ